MSQGIGGRQIFFGFPEEVFIFIKGHLVEQKAETFVLLKVSGVSLRRLKE
jgi:hypothetical protein